MKSRVLMFAVLMLIVGFIWWHWRRTPDPRVTIAPIAAAGASSTIVSAASGSATSPHSALVPGQAERARLNESTREQHESFRAAYATPRDLYGLVVDDQEHPIEGASVDVSIADQPWSEKGSKYHLVSGQDGRFSLLGRPGADFYVKVSKTGCLAYSASRGSVFYAIPNDPFSHPPPTWQQPTKFSLHQSNPAAQMIYHELDQKVAKDGSPCEVSLTTGRQTALEHGDLRVEAWTPERAVPRERVNWRCRISVPDGGLVERSGELSFDAPEVGYVPSFEFDRHTEEQNRVPGSARKRFFVKTREGKYARIDFEMHAGGDHFFTLLSYLNPSGSRNLEVNPDPQSSPP